MLTIATSSDEPDKARLTRNVLDATSPYPGQRLGEILVSTGALPVTRLGHALRLQRRRRGGYRRLGFILISERLVSPHAVATGLALQRGVWRAPVQPSHGDPELMDLIGADICLRYRLLPLRREGNVAVIATSRLAGFEAVRHAVEERVGPLALAVADEAAIEAAIHAQCHEQLVALAETRPQESLSVRQWSPAQLSLGVLVLFAAMATAIAFAPTMTFNAAAVWASLCLLGMSSLKLAALLVRSRRLPPLRLPLHADRLPKVSLLVPLLSEAQMSTRLVSRLQALDYPVDRLEICLAIEHGDRQTLHALRRAGLPDIWKLVEVPAGSIKTKPRALNFALDHADGDIIAVYDAEDAPEPDQLRKVAAHFATAPPEVVCLQGQLGFYNARQSWITRCFALDYAAWFRVVLPGLAQLGLVVPLGGTTLFLRRAALEAMGRWDAHNVTEDADLGIRLARVGFRTEILDSVTEEEATTTVITWVRQRSRWLKGYALTWAVHTSRPLLLLRNLGPIRFLGMQVLFLGTVSLFLLAPLLWSFLLIPFGLPHPFAGTWFVPLAMLFGVSEVINLATNVVAVNRKGDRWLMPWAPTLFLYFPLGVVAAWRGLTEIIIAPFRWEKTEHGHSRDHRDPDPVTLVRTLRRFGGGESRTRY